MLGQYSEGDYDWTSRLYDDWGSTRDLPVDLPDEPPPEGRYVQIYQQQQEAQEAELVAQESGGFFDTLKSVVQVLSPVATSVIRATQPRPETTAPMVSPTLPSGATVGGQRAGMSPLLIGGLAFGAYMLMRGRKGKGRRERK